MKMLRYVYVAASLPALACSFAGPTTVRTLAKASTTLVASSAASNHNEEEKKLETAMFKSWTDLQKKGKQLEQNPAAVSLVGFSAVKRRGNAHQRFWLLPYVSCTGYCHVYMQHKRTTPCS